MIDVEQLAGQDSNCLEKGNKRGESYSFFSLHSGLRKQRLKFEETKVSRICGRVARVMNSIGVCDIATFHQIPVEFSDSNC